MPPKGWRKYGESSQMPKESELVSIDELLFPRSTIQKLAKSILNVPDSSTLEQSTDNMSLAKDSLIAVQRSATVFVSHLMFYARQFAREAGRKSVNSQDILHALERADLAGFVPEVKQKLSTFESDADAKKKLKAEAKEASGGLDDGPAVKKMKDNSANSAEKTDDANATDLEDADEGDDADTIDEDNNATEGMDEATVLPPNEDVSGNHEEDEAGDDEEETVAANPIEALGQEEAELGGAEPEEPVIDGDDETEEE